MTRILVSGMPKTNAVISNRMTCGAWEVIQTVYSPVTGEYWAMAPRVSMGVGINPRWVGFPGFRDHGQWFVFDAHDPQRVLSDKPTPGHASGDAGAGERTRSI